MKIKELQHYIINLPFRFSFKHSLAERSFSRNVIIKAKIESKNGDLFIGYGEGIPRDYVTGEKVDLAQTTLITDYFPRFLDRTFSDCFELTNFLNNQVQQLSTEGKPAGSVWCALETALLDAACKADSISILKILPKPFEQQNSITYGAVVPFANKKALLGMLLFYKLYRFSTVKIKVGKGLEKDIENIKLARQIMGEHCTLRVDANCAWSIEDTIKFSEQSQPYKIASIEQPLPADDTNGLFQLASTLPQAIVLDESLCTFEQAKHYAHQKSTNNKLNIEFNIRLSKVGGFISASSIRNIADSVGIKCHLGAQVGESGILTQAARIFAFSQNPFINYEGAANMLLLRHDVTRENLTYSFGGLGKLPNGTQAAGLGIAVEEKRLLQLAEESKISAGSIKVPKHASL